MEIEYKTATDLETAWLNFELDLPLEPMPDGGSNPFYVNRPGNPTARLERELRRPYHQPPKYFFSGHRGCGKSTELRRLTVNPEILKRFVPFHFSIRDAGDINNLDYRDVLLAIGGQMFGQYREKGGKLPEQMLKELASWAGRIEEVITTSDRIGGFDIEGRVNAIFAEAGLKMKLEPKTRHVLRQVLERNITDLIDVINKIATSIHAKTQKPPLILIDDLDKPDLEQAKEIFYERREIMLQPACPIVYTVSSSLFYSQEFEAIRDRSIFLPNIKLHPQSQPDQRDADGYYALRMFVHKRMDPALIEDEALELAASMSGGVFRELARIMRGAVDRAMARDASQVALPDVEGAAAEIRGEYRRILTDEQQRLLLDVQAHNQLDQPDKYAPLMQMLAILEYETEGEPWCDVHPALDSMLDEMRANS